MVAEIALQKGIAPRVCPATLWNISQNCLASSSGESASLAPHIVTVATWPEKALATPGVASLATVTVTTVTRADFMTGGRSISKFEVPALVFSCIETNFCKKYSLESSRRDLHNALLCTIL